MSRPKKENPSKTIPVKLDEELRQRIEKLAERMGEAKSTVMRIAMRIGLERLEKAYDEPGATTYPPSREEHAIIEERPKSNLKRKFG